MQANRKLEAIQQVQLRNSKDNGHKILGERSSDPDINERFYGFATRGIKHLKLDHLSKADRTQLTNCLSVRLLDGVKDDLCRQTSLYVLIRLMENPNTTMDLVGDLLEVSTLKLTSKGKLPRKAPRAWEKDR